ncbi:hypothetical protein HU200_064534 [Digitaria exilis]|uniref:AB hydrolase-1 domain-containing protein n=1 Tax=Digitaria exilis TaxID=1010633 RepID=A0A835A9H9_9POAL|nr:hypothetical protein HU200_064534 [Digitaria exilis]
MEEHFVLVHGACHGAWCWFKLASLLQATGHRVSCIDLAGAAGSLVDPDDVRSFDEYDAPLVEFMAALPDGHKLEQQEAMIRRWPPRKVMFMDTDHSPFFSAPDHLFELILKSS